MVSNTRRRTPVLENRQRRGITGLAGRTSADRPLGDVVTYENEDRMSATIARYRILGTVVIFSLGLMLAGCSGNAGDPGAERSQQQSKELRDRVNSTQIDR